MVKKKITNLLFYYKILSFKTGNNKKRVNSVFLRYIKQIFYDEKLTGDDVKMDIERVRQIIESDGVIEVLYQGSPVWIEKVLNNNQAQVSDIKTSEVNEVPVYMLVEKELPKNMH